MTNKQYKLFKINLSKTNVLIDEFINLSKFGYSKKKGVY